MQPKKNAFVGLWEKFQAFLKTPAGLPIVVCVAGVALVGAAVAVTVAARGGDSLPGSVSTSWSEPEDDKTYDAEAGKVNKEEFTGIILPVTEDAGQEYLDETLFIGDSNTARYMYYGPDDDSDVHFTTIENTVGVVSAGVQNITSLKWEHFVGKGDMAIPEIVQIMQPQRIIICFGTNNLTMETDTFIDYYTKGLAAIEEAWPHADIIVSAIPPLDKERSNTNLSMKQVDRLNTAIVEMCEAEGYKYLDTSEALEDPDTGWAKDGYTLDLDGVHLSKNGARALFEYIRTHAYITEDTRPKPLKDIPKINGVTPGLITQDPIGVSGSSLVPVEISASEGGHIVGETSQSVKKGQQTSMITAVADDGWEFSHWSASIGFVDQQESIMFTVPGNADANGVFLTAHFRRVEEEPDPTPSPTPSPSPSPSPNPTSKPSSTSTPATSTPATSTPATSTPATSTPATSTPATSTPATSTPSTAQPEPTPCPHDYKETSSTPATCEAAGSRTFTCSLCGNSYTEPIQALGHNYVDGVCAACGAKDPNYTEPAPAPDNTQTEGGDEVDGAQNVTNVPPAEEQPADNGGGDVT